MNGSRKFEPKVLFEIRKLAGRRDAPMVRKPAGIAISAAVRRTGQIAQTERKAS
jgi:hypothetical protein